MTTKSLTMIVGEKEPLEFDFSKPLAFIWEPEEEYTVGQYRRPTGFNGFAYIVDSVLAGTVGQSAIEEPDWPTTLGQTVTDGSVIWLAVDFSLAADSIVTAPVVSDSDGVIGTPNVGPTDVVAEFTAVSVGVEVVTCTMTSADGRVRKGRFRITIKS